MSRRRALLASTQSQNGGGLIKFIINEGFKPSYPVEYIAEEGMTWEQWVNSSYNTSGYKLEDLGFRIIVMDNSGEFFVTIGGGSVSAIDIIDANVEYSWG